MELKVLKEACNRLSLSLSLSLSLFWFEWKMGSLRMFFASVVIIIILLLYLSTDNETTGAAAEQQQLLQVGFYKNSCPHAELIVAEEVRKSFYKDTGIAAGIIRLSFHDCFVRGCDASILIDSTEKGSSEKDGPPNGITVRGFEVIDRAKARLEAACKGVVSCADILQFAARDSFILTHGGIGWKVPSGRRDGNVSVAKETEDIPSPSDDLNKITAAFAKKGLSRHEMVALLGAHTIGRSHCTAFSDRLYNFSKDYKQDPSLSPHIAEILKLKCPIIEKQEGGGTDVDPNLVVEINSSPVIFENSYYGDVIAHRALFTSDQALLTGNFCLPQVSVYAFSDWKWKVDFVTAMIKMSQIEVLTGNDGEIRQNCRVVNSHQP